MNEELRHDLLELVRAAARLLERLLAPAESRPQLVSPATPSSPNGGGRKLSQSPNAVRMRAKRAEAAARRTHDQTHACARVQENVQNVHDRDLSLFSSKVVSIYGETERKEQKKENEIARTTEVARVQNVQSVRAERAERATRIPPEDGPALDAFIAQWRIDTKHVEWPKFRDHFRAKSGQDARKNNWRCTWDNWLRRYESGEFGPRKTYAEKQRELCTQPRAEGWRKKEGLA